MAEKHERLVMAEGDTLVDYFDAIHGPLAAPQNARKLEIITGDKIDAGKQAMASSISLLGNHRIATLLDQFAEDDTQDKEEYGKLVNFL